MNNQKNNSLAKYAGLGFQFLVAIGLGVFIGLKVDEWLAFTTPLFVWILPLTIIFGVIYKIIRETSQKK